MKYGREERARAAEDGGRDRARQALGKGRGVAGSMVLSALPVAAGPGHWVSTWTAPPQLVGTRERCAGAVEVNRMHGHGVAIVLEGRRGCWRTARASGPRCPSGQPPVRGRKGRSSPGLKGRGPARSVRRRQTEDRRIPVRRGRDGTGGGHGNSRTPADGSDVQTGGLEGGVGG